MTRDEARGIRNALDAFVNKIADSPAEINAYPEAIRTWKPGVHVVTEVRSYKGIPYDCLQTHDSTGNPGWTPDAAPALWMQYHGTTVETARAWAAPTGAHDMYKAGEYMVWTDGTVYRCVRDTAYSPVDDPTAWEAVTA